MDSDTELAQVMLDAAASVADRAWRRYYAWIALFAVTGVCWLSAFWVMVTCMLVEQFVAAAWICFAFVVLTLFGVLVIWRTEVARRAWTRAEVFTG